MKSNVAGVVYSLLAALATAVGGSCVFFVSPHLSSSYSVCLAVASGAMIFVSMLEIFPEGMHHIDLALQKFSGLSPNVEQLMFFDVTDVEVIQASCRLKAYALASLLFFTGWCITSLVDKGISMSQKPKQQQTLKNSSNLGGRYNHHDPTSHVPFDFETRPVEHDFPDDHAVVSHERNTDCDNETVKFETAELGNDLESQFPNHGMNLLASTTTSFDTSPAHKKYAPKESELPINFERVRLGYVVIIVVALHNIPEGAATYAAASSAQSRLKIGMCVAIGIHNLFEGMAVAVPMYFATENRFRSFAWAAMTGIPEVLGALICFGLLGSNPPLLPFGILFSLVSGIMLHVSVCELMCNAFKYDKEHKLVVPAFVIGMVLMSCSLLLSEWSTSGMEILQQVNFVVPSENVHMASLYRTISNPSN